MEAASRLFGFGSFSFLLLYNMHVNTSYKYEYVLTKRHVLFDFNTWRTY